MKTRMITAASIFLAVVLIATTSYALPSCCDPKNSSAATGTLAQGQPMSGPGIVAAPQARVVTRQAVPAPVRPTPKYLGMPLPKRQYAAAKPAGLLSAPAAPSCCALPNNSGPARAINPATQGPPRGCGCCGTTGAQAKYSGFQPPPGQVQFMSNPASAGQPVSPGGQASCCSPTGPGNNPVGWNAAQPASFPGLWLAVCIGEETRRPVSSGA